MDFAEPWGPGHVIANKYRLVRQLGRGGMGSVWAADHLALSSQVAVKIIDPAIAKNEEALTRFLREAQAAAALRSPHVVQTFDYGVHEGVPYIAMELLEGESLAQRLDQVKTIPLEETAHILTQVGRAIARAHEAGIVHRDLKPDNIFLVRNDDEEIAKVLDFGIAKATGGALGNSSQTRTGAILGTPYYMSPEQAEGNRSVDHRTDLWSLAIITFECVTGKRPFESEALGDLILQICIRPIKLPSSVVPVPHAFDAWYQLATQRDPAQRFQSARELTVALRAAAGLKADMGRGRTMPSTADLPIAMVSAPTPQPAFNAQTPPRPLSAQTPQRPLQATTGGAGVLTNDSDEPVKLPAQTSTPLLIGSTLAALALAGTIAFFVFRSKGHDAEPQAQSATAASVAAPAAAPQKATPEPAKTVAAEPPTVVPAVQPAASAAPATAEAPKAEQPAEPTTSAHKAATAPAHPAKASSSSAKKGEGAAAAPSGKKQRVDFGF